MSLWCECIECAGDDPNIPCENKLLDAQVSAWRTQAVLYNLKLASLALSGLTVMLGLVLQS